MKLTVGPTLMLGEGKGGIKRSQFGLEVGHIPVQSNDCKHSKVGLKVLLAKTEKKPLNFGDLKEVVIVIGSC